MVFTYAIDSLRTVSERDLRALEHLIVKLKLKLKFLSYCCCHAASIPVEGSSLSKSDSAGVS